MAIQFKLQASLTNEKPYQMLDTVSKSMDVTWFNGITLAFNAAMKFIWE